jgi:hypothetical protein
MVQAAGEVLVKTRLMVCWPPAGPRGALMVTARPEVWHRPAAAAEVPRADADELAGVLAAGLAAGADEDVVADDWAAAPDGAAAEVVVPLPAVLGPL